MRSNPEAPTCVLEPPFLLYFFFALIEFVVSLPQTQMQGPWGQALYSGLFSFGSPQPGNFLAQSV